MTSENSSLGHQKSQESFFFQWDHYYGPNFSFRPIFFSALLDSSRDIKTKYRKAPQLFWKIILYLGSWNDRKSTWNMVADFQCFSIYIYIRTGKQLHRRGQNTSVLLVMRRTQCSSPRRTVKMAISRKLSQQCIILCYTPIRKQAIKNLLPYWRK